MITCSLKSIVHCENSHTPNIYCNEEVAYTVIVSGFFKSASVVFMRVSVSVRERVFLDGRPPPQSMVMEVWCARRFVIQCRISH